MEHIIDIECDGLNPTKIHCAIANGTTVSKSFFESLTKDDVLIGHNIIRFDIPVIERIYNITIQAKLVDTLAVSWYLYPERNKHGLADWGVDLGVPKPKIDDWENLTLEEYTHRCKEDVKINTLLWKRQQVFLKELYLEGYQHLLDYLNFKMHCAMLQEKNKWKLDVGKAEELLFKLTESQARAVVSLEGVMPRVQTYKKVSRPTKPYKKDGSLSVTGEKWTQLCKDNDINFDSDKEYSVPAALKEPKATSPVQVKDWLFGLGWSPMTFKYVEDGVDHRGMPQKRAIPQIKKGDNLCPSVVKMINSKPEIKHLEDFGIVAHRKGLVTGLLKNVDDNGFVIAGIQGLTNTLRFKHAVCVNIPSPRMPYGTEIRSLLTSSSNEHELCGSDMSSLEDRTKQHYMMPIDPDYVKEMNKDGFDPHLDIAVEAGFLTRKQSEAYKAGNFSVYNKAELTAQRHKGKTTNYASTYGAGAETIARGADATVAEGKRLHTAYWERNWSLKAIADEQITKTLNRNNWLYNPVSKIWYVLRSKKDIFSTLNQGTGTYCFDMWLKEMLKKDVKFLGQFHDEIIFEVPLGYRVGVTKYLKSCVSEVNKTLNLNRELDVDVDFGFNYSEIH